jgi:RNA polymerase sigma-70 factor (ECF subfamily)
MVRSGGDGCDDAQPSDGAAGARSFGAIVPSHLPAMLRVAGALVGAADAEDAAQEAILRAWRAWDTLRDVSLARAWLLRITANVCRDWQRGRFGTHRALNLPLLDDESALPVALLAADPGASDSTGALDLREAINALDHRLRSVVVLRYYADLDATEIGALLDLPPPTVRTRLRRSLTLLRQRLSGQSSDGALPPQKGAR